MRLPEKARQFGPSQSLLGIVTEPPEAAPAGERPAVLILNAGTLHHVGPSRVHVQLARRLAAGGFVAMRFDFSGMGDSAAREDGLPFASSVIQETREAMDFLARSRGVTRFALFGICSGADNALRAACADPRVVGAALVDPYNLPSAERVLHVYANRLLRLRSWGRLLSGRSQVLASARKAVALQRNAQTGADYASLLPSREEFVAALKTLADRGVQVELLYTGESPGYVHYRRLLRRPLRRWESRDRIRVEYLRDADHVFTLIRSQRRLLELIERWVGGLPREPAAARPAGDR
jgi:hypothetical protein